MVITEVRIKLMEDEQRTAAGLLLGHLRRRLRRPRPEDHRGHQGLVRGHAQPQADRPLPRCGCKNHLRARFCNQCGHRLDENRATRDADGRAKLHADIAHPINSACREVIQTAVIKAYHGRAGAGQAARLRLHLRRLRRRRFRGAELWRRRDPRHRPRSWPAHRVAATTCSRRSPGGRDEGGTEFGAGVFRRLTTETRRHEGNTKKRVLLRVTFVSSCLYGRLSCLSSA